MENVRDELLVKNLTAIVNRLPFSTTVEMHIPECIGLKFYSTGVKGGNRSHGAEATLILNTENGFLAGVDNDCHVNTTRSIEIKVAGDIEIQSLIQNLIDLGLQLKEQYPHLVPDKGYDHWGYNGK